MKKIIFALAFSLIMLACATVQQHPALLAEYYKTYATKTEFLTEQFFPEKDYFWVAEEKRNGDNIEVPLVWVDEVNASIGVVFDLLDEEGTNDICAIIRFSNNDDMETFLNEFDTSLIRQGIPMHCENFFELLKGQLNTKIPRSDVAID